MRLRRRRYHEGGGIPPHEHLADGSHPILGYNDDTSEDSNILGSLITDTTQEADATRVDMPGVQSLQPGAQPITIIEDPQIALYKEIYGDDWEEELNKFNKREAERKAEREALIKSIMFGTMEKPLGEYPEFMTDPYKIDYNPGTYYSREEAEDILDQITSAASELEMFKSQGHAIQMAGPFNDPIFGVLLGGAPAVRSSLGAGLNWLYKPMLKKIPGLGGLTGHHILSALGLHHMVTETPKSIQEFIDNPSPGQALHVTWDALMGVPGMIELKKGIPASMAAFREGKRLARFKRGPDGLGSFLWDDAAMNWKKMTQAEIDWLAAAEARNPKLIGALTEPAEGGAALQQTGPLGQLAASDASVAASNVPVAASEAVKAAETTPVLQNLAKDHQKDRPRTKKGGYVSEDAGEVYLESNVATTGSSTDTGDFDAVPGVVQNVENPGVYQFSLFVEGGPLEKSVRAKDGTIAISEIEKAANNLPKRSINEKNAILEALDNTRQVKANPNFDPNKPVDPNTNPEYLPVDRIDYETFRSYLSSTIQPAEVVVTKDQANYGVDRLGYTTDPEPVTYIDSRFRVKDVVTNTYVYKDPQLGLGPRHGGIEESSYWVRTADEVENPTVRLITEIQTNNPALKGSKSLKEYIKQVEWSLTLRPNVEVEQKLEDLKNQLKINNANSENLAVKQLNEIFLQAARDGKEVVMFPTVQTSMKIQNHTFPMVFRSAAQDMSIGLHINPNTQEEQLFNYNNTEFRNNLFEVNKKGNYNFPTANFGLIRLALRPDIQKLFRIDPSNYEKTFDAKLLREKGPEELAYDEALGIVKSMYEIGNKQQYRPGDIFHKDFLTSDGFKSLSEETQKALTEVHETLYKTLDYDVSSFPRKYRNVHSKYDELMSKFKNEFNMDFEITVDSKGNLVYKVNVPEKFFNQDLENPSEFKTYKKGGILQAMAKKNRPDKNKFVSKKVRILRREGKGLRQAVAIALDMYEKKKKEKKFQEGGLFQRLKDRREKIKAAKEYYKEEAENPTMYLNEEGKIMMPGVGYDTGEPVYYEEELTPRQYKRFNKAAFRNYKRDLRRADREARQQERQERRDERIKERGYRRVGRADILPFDTEDILDYLAGESNAGYYLGPKMLGRLTSRRFRDKVGNISMNPVSDNTGLISSVEKGADDSVLDHELIHKSQYGPLQLLASYIGLPGAGRIQDKTTRKAFKNLMKSIRKNDTVLDENLGGAAQGNYMAGDKSRDVEFDAILKSGLSSASVAGYDLEGKSFDEIVSILAQAEEDGNISTNMGHLSRFMTGTNWNDEQKGFIMDAIKANLGREAFTAEDARQDLR